MNSSFLRAHIRLRRRGHRAVALVAGLAIAVPSLVAAMPPPVYHGKIWSPFALKAPHSVPGHALAAHHKRTVQPVHEPAGHPALTYRPLARAVWPAAGAATVTLNQVAGPASADRPGTTAQHGKSGTTGASRDGSAATPGARQAGKLPVWVGPVAGKAARQAPASVRVGVAGHGTAASAGIHGVIMSVARADGGRSAGAVSLRLGYASFARDYGGGWAFRLHLVELPACALITPGAAGCRRETPLASHNDAATQSVTATVPVPAAGQVVIAATSLPSGSIGNYTATSLKPSGTWAVQDGDFTYSYPITVPPALGGQAPDVSLDYDSQSIDSETSGTNTQASWIGDGWDYQPGFIEQSYQTCSQAQTPITNSGDECWAGSNATLSLNGQSNVLVEDSSGGWHLQDDDGTKVQLLTGASNGVWNGEYWLVTTPDGTKYYFGQNHLPGGGGSDTATNSAWSEPVYCPGSTDPCHSSTWVKNMPWRWNLDYVVDPHGNLTMYDYNTETNYYSRGGGQNDGNGTLTQYVRAGYPVSISYGYLLSDAINGAKPSAQVLFGTSQRCLTPASTCASYSNLNSTTASDWPDTPYDQNCNSTGSCTNYSPTFWSTVRLTSITTQVLEGSSYQQADSYALDQSFPYGAGSDPVMYLNWIQHTGEDGAALSLPKLGFALPTEIDNRVDGLTPASPPVYRPRVDEIDTEAGAKISIVYKAPACSRVNGTMPSAADTNAMPCFPVWWTPDQAPIEDWFNKSLVGQVSVSDQTNTKSPSPSQVTNYSYQGGAAWHQNESPVISNQYRTWDQFRGYAEVTTTTGAGTDPITQTSTYYMQGMNGDPLSGGGTQTATEKDTLGEQITDDNWLAGQVLETDTFTQSAQSGGTVDKKVINGPWSYTQTADQSQPDSLPDLTAHMLQSDKTRTLDLLANTNWRTAETDTSYNSDGQVSQVDDKGDVSAPSQEVCTTTSYASSTANPMMENYPDDVLAVAGPCGTTPSASTTVSDTRTFYDGPGTLSSMGTFGSISGPGNVTGTQAISSYSGGNPVYQPKSAATYDSYGRTLTSTDANGNTTTTAYTPAAGHLPTQVVATNPMGWTTTTAMDQARQLPVQVTDPNGEITSETYDSLGRLTAVWLPTESEANKDPANYTYTYAIDGTNPASVTTSTLREDNSRALDVKIYDGMLQLRQEQTTTADNETGRLITDTHYDSHGWTTVTSSPYYDKSNAPDSSLFNPTTTLPAQTVTQYDGQGRAIASQFLSEGNLQWQTTTAYPGADETDVTPPTGGTATSTFTNALGQTTATWEYAKSATPDGKASDADVTSYTYTPGGQVASVADNNGNALTYTYNLLGQKVSQSDPDGGTTTYGYDANGNLTSTTDARGKTVDYTYDALNRKTAEYAGSVAPANELASWTYDTLEKGYPTSSTAYTSGASGPKYVEAITGYDSLYQGTGTTITIPSTEGNLAGAYTTSSTYTPITGLLEQTIYSADGGLPGETVGYSYDLQGLVTQMGGNTAYLDQATYDPEGQITRSAFGSYGSQLVNTESYDAGTNRLLQTTTNLQPLSSAADTVNYTYNQAGDITSTSDQQNTGGTQLQCYTYNNLQELTQAWTDTQGTSTAGGTSVEGIGGCNTTSPSASTIGGPAPYWQSYTYDLLGDRTSQTNHDTSGDTGNNVIQTLAYPGGGTTAASDPNQASTVTTTGPGGTTTTTDGYNADGGTTSQSSSSTGSSPPTAVNRSISYNALGQTSSVTTGGQTSSYLYDADGNLLIQRDPGTTTLYLDGGAEQLVMNTALKSNPVSGLRFYAAPDGTTIVRSSTATDPISYEVGNQQGTALEAIDATSLAITRRYYDPYGNSVGAAPSSWPDQMGFVGQPTDSSTSLDLLGARQYDPVTGRFMSVDPVFEAGDPTQMGGYAYAGDNPVSHADPEGQYITGDNGCQGSWQACEQEHQQHSPPPCPDYDPGCPGFTGGGAGSQGETLLGSSSRDRFVKVSTYVYVAWNNPELGAYRRAWARYVASQQGTPLPDTPEAQAESWVAICSQNAGLCPADFSLEQNKIGSFGQFMPDPGAVATILSDVHDQQRIGTGIRLPQALSGMAATGSIGKLAQQFGVSQREIRSAIESAKQDGLPRGGPVRNTNVVVDEEGEVYPLGPGGVPAEDSIGNILDYIGEDSW
jgi:RHS repeat-associated protein